ncbi:hypothetical protein KKC83_01545 [Patescibacteria group bacterium]|nr:hypothetical protein [Candidatus Falkowbacteria bacterium]MBU4015568.1 hypothetical protein [Patescibacteria group bacterium]MBU4026209.1 hypothetical protein [Patescibacteria group bacterium]MBU4072788.1 hypothetical protein [Patescibacteria group bacterium]MBU4103404.1 hypothetical protein [Patescibacteria group bacterium]
MKRLDQLLQILVFIGFCAMAGSFGAGWHKLTCGIGFITCIIFFVRFMKMTRVEKIIEDIDALCQVLWALLMLSATIAACSCNWLLAAILFFMILINTVTFKEGRTPIYNI